MKEIAVRRAYLIIILPAAVVAVFYLAIFRGLGFEVRLAPFLGTAAVFFGALIGVWRYQRRKQGGRGG
ncbi:MAG TPA: hypothetical protein VIG89_08535 [Candidatus Acidoferrales bacterium]